MNTRSVISRICSVGLLLVMMLSITPKTFLHELFAHHNDVVACNDADLQGPCIHKQGYNCQQTDLVVPSPFDTDFETELRHAERFMGQTPDLYSSSTSNTDLPGIPGRGPPAHV